MTEPDILALGFASIPDLVHAHALRAPMRPALSQEAHRLNYAELDIAMDRVAASLQRDGLAAGECIAVCAADSLDYVVIFLGALRAGIVVAPLSAAATAVTLSAMIADCGARLLFVDAAAAASLASVRDRIGARRVGLDAASLAAWLAPAGSVPQPVAPRPDWPFNIIYSSGTTGTPKGIVQPWAMRWGHVQRFGTWLAGTQTVMLIATPLYSNTTLVSLLPTLAVGGSVVLMGRFDAPAYLALAERQRVTHTMLVPVQYQRIMAAAEFSRYDLSAFHLKFCTSAPFPAVLKADVLSRWPGGVLELYGMTEGGVSCLLAAHEFPGKLHTVGRPAPGCDIRLIDDSDRELGPGATGEVVGRSAAMMRGYHGLPQQSADMEWYDAAGRRYLRSGDIGRFDADGFLILLDRKKDLIISGGFNIYPSDLEAELAQHEDVADCAVVGVASRRWGETPVAFVVLREGAHLEAESLRTWVNARVGKTQRLAALNIVASLPRSAIGKVLKRELRDGYAAPLD